MKQFELGERFKNQSHLALPAQSKFPLCRNYESWSFLKIISASASYKHYKSNRFVAQRKNFLRPNLSDFGGHWHTGFAKYLSEDAPFEDIFEQYENRGTLENAFYKSLNVELLNFLRFQNLGHHTSAFIHLYRMLEHSAYAAPMLFVLSERSFVKSYNELSRWFTAEKQRSELAFFKKFVESVFDSSMMLTELEFSLLAPTDEIREKHYKTLKRMAGGKSYNFTEIVLNENFSVPFSEVSSFIITIRNRFFHYGITNNGNISSDDLMDSDDFFYSLNDMLMHWLSTLLVSLAQRSIST
ncbi:hypothetical protein [Litorimonas cladophorae]|uniref:hypothetical protein n=1 Tax=Litorimonas cladophorae TaxID=1220491 RepID=UPI001678A74E|nr:hypothetical protein [Litorimonas cladophorae]